MHLVAKSAFFDPREKF